MDRLLHLKPAAFLFDLDGTLIDSEMLWVRAIVGWLAEQDLIADENTIAALVLGHSWLDIHASLLDHFPTLPKNSAARDALALRVHYNRLSIDPTAIIIPSAVAFYKAAAKIAPCAIVSGSPRSDVANAVQLCGIAKETAFVLGGEDYAHGKPAPDGYLLAAQRFGVTPAQCIVLEDSTAGVRSGLAAGMKVVGIDRGTVIQQDFTGCFITVHDLAEFTRR